LRPAGRRHQRLVRPHQHDDGHRSELARWNAAEHDHQRKQRNTGGNHQAPLPDREFNDAIDHGFSATLQLRQVLLRILLELRLDFL
jgi:hypothetical protein